MTTDEIEATQALLDQLREIHAQVFTLRFEVRQTSPDSAMHLTDALDRIRDAADHIRQVQP